MKLERVSVIAMKDRVHITMLCKGGMMPKRLLLLVCGFFMLFSVVAYATTMTENIEPNKEGLSD